MTRKPVYFAQCKLAWEGNEEEYEDFYDWGDEDGDSPAGTWEVLCDC